MSAKSPSPPAARRLRTAEFNGITLVEGLHPAGSTLPWHSHDGASICLVLRGAFAEYSRGARLDCAPSSLKLTPAGEPHWNRFDRGDVRGLMIEIDPARFAPAERFGTALAERRQFGAGPEVALARRVHAELCTMDSAAPLAIEGLLLELVARFARGGSAGIGGEPPRWVTCAADLLHAMPAARLALSDIAAEVGVHPATLARGFRSTYGTSLGAYQRQLRLELAARLLATTDLPVAAIAQQCGFFDQSHLTNSFRRYLGAPPSRYRRDLRIGA